MQNFGSNLITVVLSVALAAVVAIFISKQQKEVAEGAKVVIDILNQIKTNGGSEVVKSDGKAIAIHNAILFRIPFVDDSTHKSGYESLEQWLTTEYGGWSRWESKSQSKLSNSNGPTETRLIYFVGIGGKENIDVPQRVKSKLNQLFPDDPSMLIVTMPQIAD